MVTYVLDSSAVLRYLDGQAGAERVAEIIKGHIGGRCAAIMSSLHWGEVAGHSCKMRGKQGMDLVISRLSAFGIEVITVDGDQAVGAALFKLKRHIPYVDAFGIELTAGTEDSVFVTADFDFKPASRDVKIEFLPAK
jgi:PIN domain nuclease of toxin-antitoxin system